MELLWIQDEGKEWKPFVHNRMKEIQELVSVNHWSHCPGNKNPADIPSRGVSLKELKGSLLWRHGPDWLPRILLEESDTEITIPQECIVETVIYQNVTHSLLSSTKCHGVGELTSCERFSKTIEVTEGKSICEKIVLRFKSFTKDDCTLVDWTITAEDIEAAEMDWVTDCQRHVTREVQFDMWKRQLDLCLISTRYGDVEGN